MIKQLIQKVVKSEELMLTIAMVGVNAGNYILNLFLGRFLGPELFAEASILATSVLLLSFFAVGLQLTSAKYNATYFVEKDDDKMKAFSSFFNQKIFLLSIVLCILILLALPLIKNYLHFRSIWPLFLILICIPIYFSLSIYRGYHQGKNGFKKLAHSYISEMIIRLIVTVGLLIIFHDHGWSSEIISIGFLLSFIGSFFFTKVNLVKTLEQFDVQKELKHIAMFLGIIMIYELSQVMINNSDILMTKHFFPAYEAGLYGALALVGRIVFFGTWVIVTLLFPKVIQKEKKGENHIPLFLKSLLAVMIIGFSMVIGCFFFGELMIQILFGIDYIQVAPLLWKYALATSLFASANVFAYYYMSLEIYMPVSLTILAGILQIIFIQLFHGSMEQIIIVQILIMSGLLLSMLLFFTFKNFSNQMNIKDIAPSSIKLK